MSLADALKLAPLTKDISLQDIKQGVIDNSMVTFANVKIGNPPVAASVDKPIPDKIRVLRDEIFTSNGPTSPIAQGDPLTLLKADAAKIMVINNTYTNGLDSCVGNYLISQGVAASGGSPTGASDQTIVIVYAPKLYALRYLIQTIGIKSSNQIIIKPTASPQVDIELRLGNDALHKFPGC
jgi:hypothetical protein